MALLWCWTCGAVDDRHSRYPLLLPSVAATARSPLSCVSVTCRSRGTRGSGHAAVVRVAESFYYRELLTRQPHRHQRRHHHHPQTPTLTGRPDARPHVRCRARPDTDGPEVAICGLGGRSPRPARRRPHSPICLVGYDNIPEAAYVWSPSTTVRQDFGEAGRRALELLVTQIEGEPRTGTLVAREPELVARGSSGPPA
ncbi:MULTISPECIES: substrate-binding domain-containing protein [unclassified Streptomyces]